MNSAESGIGDCVGKAILFIVALCLPLLLIFLGILVIGAVVFFAGVKMGVHTSRESRYSYASTKPWLLVNNNTSVA